MAVDSGERSDLKAVIFDYGEVLSHKPTADQTASLASFFGVGIDRLTPLWERNRGPYDRGDLAPEAYWSMLARDAGTSLSSGQVEEICKLDVAMWSSLNPTMVDWAKRLGSHGLKVALLSNMHSGMVAHCRRHFTWLNEFDFVTFSAEVNLIKPDPAIYHHTLRGLGVSASEALFLDDRAVNIQAARKLGITAIQFQSVRQLRRELRAVGFPVLPLTESS
jgi:putative hydrolase of the HAD superfamily